MIHVKNKDLVVPGTILSDNEYRPSDGSHRQETNVVASVVGFVRIIKKEISVIGFEGVYDPAVGDVIIGVVEDVGHNCWFVDTNSPYSGLLPASEIKKEDQYVEDLKDILGVGEFVVAKIISKDYNKQIKITANDTDLGKEEGYLVHVSPKKVARIIGKRGSMISNLKKYTESTYIVGKNGRILIKGGDLSKSVRMIKLIERESHTSGLTNHVKELLEEESKIAK